MTYAAGFDAGERASFADRRTGQRRELQPHKGEWHAGFAAGYCPRNPQWQRCVRDRVESDAPVCNEIDKSAPLKL